MLPLRCFSHVIAAFIFSPPFIAMMSPIVAGSHVTYYATRGRAPLAPCHADAAI